MFTTDDKVFIRAILSNPAELTAWLVYADWLDEHDNPLQAEFLRLMVRRGQLRNTELECCAVEARLTEIRDSLDPDWVAVFDRPTIENCEPVFKSRCPKRWENLKGTNDPNVRHCDSCQKPVHYCRTLPEAQAHTRQGHCVAVQLGVQRHPGDLSSRNTAETAGALLERLVDESHRRSASKATAPRRPWWKFWS
jgi:uncharacterized protein (TIGR02996 family)